MFMDEYIQKQNESRKDFLIRIAIGYIRRSSDIVGFLMNYDNAECDGECLADDLEDELEVNPDKKKR
jgi:hypothetical protein